MLFSRMLWKIASFLTANAYEYIVCRVVVDEISKFINHGPVEQKIRTKMQSAEL